MLMLSSQIGGTCANSDILACPSVQMSECPNVQMPEAVQMSIWEFPFCQRYPKKYKKEDM